MAEPRGLAAWNEPGAPGRISPRECIANARDDLNKAWAHTGPESPVPLLVGALDWMRRALEQMASAQPEDECP